jgi:hypothetical protein
VATRDAAAKIFLELKRKASEQGKDWEIPHMEDVMGRVVTGLQKDWRRVEGLAFVSKRYLREYIRCSRATKETSGESEGKKLAAETIFAVMRESEVMNRGFHGMVAERMEGAVGMYGLREEELTDTEFMGKTRDWEFHEAFEVIKRWSDKVAQTRGFKEVKGNTRAERKKRRKKRKQAMPREAHGEKPLVKRAKARDDSTTRRLRKRRRKESGDREFGDGWKESGNREFGSGWERSGEREHNNGRRRPGSGRRRERRQERRRDPPRRSPRRRERRGRRSRRR